MKLKIETMDWMIWALFILPLFILIFLLVGVEEGLLSLFLIPVVLFLKNSFIEKHFAWKPSYSVGVELFDKDHQKLFALMLEMYKALNHLPSKEEAKAVLVQLKDYTETHFSREEALMKKYEYPDFEAHCVQHEEMKNKIDEFQSKFDEEDVTVSKDVLHYLEDWLINHILITDKKYTDFFNAKGEH
ncbi:MAG: hemerythrin family protein [Gammaproteobacteria bacterium]|nr:hemerythrin family protein [Gammaproteobacteria bacterium]